MQLGFVSYWVHLGTPETESFFFKLDISFIYISNIIPFPGFPSENPLFPPTSPCYPTHPLPLPVPGIPLYWGI